jgi:hypothetical protein
MRFRRALVLPLLLSLGCQDKKPAGPPAVSESPAAAETTAAAAATTVPAPPPLEGTLDGKPFRPDAVSMDGTKDGPNLRFRRTEGTAESSIGIVSLPVPEGEKLAGREWTFGGKLEDPLVLLKRPEWKEEKGVAGPDYTMTVRLTGQTPDSVEGVIDLVVKSPPGTALKGSFKATYLKSPTAPLGPTDAPYIQGRIMLKGAKKTEKLAAGFVGVGADGKPYFNEAGFPVEIGQIGFAPVPNPEKPSQLSWLVSTEDAITYRHLNVPPGDYLVYVRRDTVMSAWKRLTLKEGDRRTLDLTIDPATTGEVVVTLPDSDAKGPAETSLALVPNKADLPELGLGSEHYFNVATVKMGEKTVKVSGIPAGKYRAVRGADEAEVEVVAGKSVAVTLVRK